MGRPPNPTATMEREGRLSSPIHFGSQSRRRRGGVASGRRRTLSDERGGEREKGDESGSCHMRNVSCQGPARCMQHAKLFYSTMFYLSPFLFSLVSGPRVHAPHACFVWAASICWFVLSIWHNELVLCYVWNPFHEHFSSTHIVHGLRTSIVAPIDCGPVWYKW
jgi:hypothetical protein